MVNVLRNLSCTRISTNISETFATTVQFGAVAGHSPDKVAVTGGYQAPQAEVLKGKGWKPEVR